MKGKIVHRVVTCSVTSLVAAVLLFAGSAGFAAELEQIMVSISNLESVDNGDGHLWSFRKTEGGKWSVEGLDGVTATVSSGGSDKSS